MSITKRPWWTLCEEDQNHYYIVKNTSSDPEVSEMAVEQPGTLVPAGVIHCTIQLKYGTNQQLRPVIVIVAL